jgi:hypothetical protein
VELFETLCFLWWWCALGCVFDVEPELAVLAGIAKTGALIGNAMAEGQSKKNNFFI